MPSHGSTRMLAYASAERRAGRAGLHRRSVGQARPYLIEHALDRGHDVVGVCRPQSVAKLDGDPGRIESSPARRISQTSPRGAYDRVSASLSGPRRRG